MNTILVFVNVLIFNLLVSESSSGHSCSVPLNIIISVDYYNLRSGTEQSFKDSVYHVKKDYIALKKTLFQ